MAENHLQIFRVCSVPLILYYAKLSLAKLKEVNSISLILCYAMSLTKLKDYLAFAKRIVFLMKWIALKCNVDMSSALKLACAPLSC